MVILFWIFPYFILNKKQFGKETKKNSMVIKIRSFEIHQHSEKVIIIDDIQKG